MDFRRKCRYPTSAATAHFAARTRANATMPLDLDKCIAQLKECETLTENEVTSTLYKMSKKEVLLGPLAAAAARQSGAAGTIIQA